MYIYIYIHIYIYVCVCMCIFILIYKYLYLVRERERYRIRHARTPREIHVIEDLTMRASWLCSLFVRAFMRGVRLRVQGSMAFLNFI